MKELKELTRENVWNLAPYSCARNEFSGRNASVYLDANENPYNSPFNRYPDPLQLEVKKQLAKVKQVPEESIFIGNGSDEPIDLMYRCFTEPKVDNVVAMDPTYGMYKVCADINDVEYRTVMLEPGFRLNAEKMLAACDEHTKIIWLCTPNNPSGNALDTNEVIKVLNGFDGFVVVDEAYSDFSSQKPFRLELAKYPNMVVLNTMSKAWGCAGIRMGMAFAQKNVIDIMNKVKYPYNVNILTQREALELLKDPYEVDKWVRTILLERSRMIDAIGLLPMCRKIHHSDANFLLVEVDDAQATYDYLVDKGIIVRNRNSVRLCEGCLRITIGTKTENQELLAALRTM
ncbi:histidinol-phosphate transaminase [Prevotella sp. P2-180]|uniref:histidinol-phosphate transaminase n=1 Tax=Prevotella sp. P2-180 TaxID=2024224 RepID=UPI000B9625C5|nr:histidinol-phosphate transaminase [Prevotella sp. P2-180]MCI6338177.1 histidinol-phosphate transaminase [Prevotella sp.]MCI7088305.1 histidinol-phosphate transaminase [Prevotella sp.]MCI7256063.1 histidinol-phosphate transaminase [Prevotella sp.]MDD5785241.1 histidinol-phosphate transaminase [Prevotella sp.]MDD6864078.1 histidinol-phosphate transaminase [Prevotella sp.]